MSQAHYSTCVWGADVVGSHGPGVPAVARVAWRIGWDDEHGGSVHWALCRACLDDQLDKADRGAVFEPVAIEWVYDAGTRFCPVHHWPAELCSDWTHNRRTLDRPDPWRSAIGPST